MAYLDFIDPGNSGGSVPPTDSPFQGLTPRVITYSCTICGCQFDTPDAQFEHRFENHPSRRPALLLKGIEIITPHQLVGSQLSDGDVVFGHVTKCHLNNRSITKDELVKYLVEKKCGLCTIHLENEGIKTSYQLDFDVPDEDELKEVERIFFETVGGGILDSTRIDLFIDMTGRFGSAKRYVHGLSNYLYGVLAKDQRGGTHLKRLDFTTKFNQALDTLRLFDKSFAHAIAGVVNFNHNVFGGAERLVATPKAYWAMRKFGGFVTGTIIDNNDWKLDASTSCSKIPLDYATEKIFEWALAPFDELLKVRKELEHTLKLADWVYTDKFKVRMLLAELLVASGDFSAATLIAGSSSNDIVFGPWGQRIIRGEGVMYAKTE